MPRKYHILCVLEEGHWLFEFGDYDKQCVKDECSDYRYNERGQGRKPKTKIHTFIDDDQESIYTYLRIMNKTVLQEICDLVAEKMPTCSTVKDMEAYRKGVDQIIIEDGEETYI